MKLFLLVLGMVLVIEGLPYIVAPEKMQGWLRKLGDVEPGALRLMGLGSLGLGLLICWIVQRSGLIS